MIARRCIGVFLLIVSLGLVTIQLWVPAFIYRPTSLNRSDPKMWGLREATAMRVPYNDGTAVTGWWSPPADADAPVVLLVHGRSANISSRSSVMQHLAAQGMGVLLFDYRGYGASPGRPSEQNLFQDTLTAYGWLRTRGVPANHIVVVGQSLGNSPATILAAQRPIGALVLVSPFTSLPDALAERLPWLPVQLVPWSHNRFDVKASLARFKGPTLLIASEDDGLIPIDNARRLQKNTERLKWLDASPLRHNGMLQGIAADGRLASAIRALLPLSTSASRFPVTDRF
ncbi:MAG: alpha/beta fold hydrolase [Oxalobacteraceae bacterium]|nr:MAG: alpha/beta fold hydrolase [Oxalobacteraceae bacterium]